MPAFSNVDIQRFFCEGEQLVTQEYNMLVQRMSPLIVAGTQAYTMPDFVKSIRRVTYLGTKLDPLPDRLLREAFQKGDQAGKPAWYIFDNAAATQIKFFPKPAVTIAAQTGNLFASPAINNGVIVEFFRISDNADWILPLTLRRQLLKQYTAKRCYSIEGPSQSMKAAKYFSQRWELKKKAFFSLMDEFYNKPRRAVLSEISSRHVYPGSPMLPIDRFGIGVDDSE